MRIGIGYDIHRFNGPVRGAGKRPLKLGESLSTNEVVGPSAVSDVPLDRSPIRSRRGYDPDASWRVVVGATGSATLQSEELDRIEVRLKPDTTGVSGEIYSGYLRAGRGLDPLPIGSHLDPVTGVFTWQPGAGFVHAYDLVFVRWVEGRALTRQEVRIVLNPKFSGHTGPQVRIDSPAPQADVVQPFGLAGWAIDPDSDIGTGVDAVHVWAYPLSGCGPRETGAPSSAAERACAPVFLGAAAYGNERPDVAAISGDGFRDSGYRLTVDGLAPGRYDLAVFAWSLAQNRFVPAKVVRVNVQAAPVGGR